MAIPITALFSGLRGLASMASMAGQSSLVKNAGNGLQSINRYNPGGALDELKNKAANLAGPFGKLANEIVGLPAKFRDMGNSMIEAQKHLAQYNGTISLANAQLNIGRTLRDIETAQKTAGSFQGLAKSQNRLESAMQPFEQAWTNVSNKFEEAINNGFASFLEGINKVPLLGDGVRYLAEMAGKDDKNTALNQVSVALSDLAKTQKIPRANPPRDPFGGA